MKKTFTVSVALIDGTIEETQMTSHDLVVPTLREMKDRYEKLLRDKTGVITLGNILIPTTSIMKITILSGV